MISIRLFLSTAHIIIINLDYNTSLENMKNMFAIILTRKWDAKKLLCGSSWIGMVMGWKRKETCIIFHGQILTSYVHSFQFRFYFTLLFLNCIFVLMRYEKYVWNIKYSLLNIFWNIKSFVIRIRIENMNMNMN